MIAVDVLMAVLVIGVAIAFVGDIRHIACGFWIEPWSVAAMVVMMMAVVFVMLVMGMVLGHGDI